jgi:hypothetical protein
MKTTRIFQGLSVLLLAALLSIFLLGCASPRAIRKEFDPYTLNQNGKYKICIAAEDTPWKQEVISQLAQELGSEYSMKVENLRFLSEVQTEEWDIVLIFSTFYAFGLQSDTESFMNELDEKENTILVVTSAISDLGDYGVSAVTAASIGNTKEDAKSLTPKREPTDVAAEIAQLIKDKL